MARILLIGEDSTLLRTRAEVLKKTGASIACASAHRATSLLEGERFDVIVLCHSLPQRVSMDLIGNVNRRWPAMKILMVASQAEMEYPIPGTDLTSSGDPGRLIEQTKHLLQCLPNHRHELVTPPVQLADPNRKIGDPKVVHRT